MSATMQFAWVALGGAMGAMSRFGIAELAKKLWGPHFPFGTLCANLLGCFLIGVLLGSGFDQKTKPCGFLSASDS